MICPLNDSALLFDDSKMLYKFILRGQKTSPLIPSQYDKVDFECAHLALPQTWLSKTHQYYIFRLVVWRLTVQFILQRQSASHKGLLPN